MTTAEPFAGFGGFRAACDQNGLQTVWGCENDPYARRAYRHFWGEEPAGGDITTEDTGGIPDHDILTGGFPCQPFSRAGVSKLISLGRGHGFADITKGTLFFDLCRILEAKHPSAFVFENVKNIRTHDKGRTMEVILSSLADLGYYVRYRLIDASHWLPQHRERVYIVGFRDELGLEPMTALWDIEIPPTRLAGLEDVLEPEPDPSYTLKNGVWELHLRHRANSLAKGSSFGYGLIEPPFEGKITRTLLHRYYKDGAEILIAQPGKIPRTLTPLECLRLQGFPAHLEPGLYDSGLSNDRLYIGFGNAVPVPVASTVVGRVKRLLEGGGSMSILPSFRNQVR